MAITNTGVTIAMSTSKLPSSTVIPSVAALTSPSSESYVHDLDGPTIDNATGATAVAAVVTAMGTHMTGTFLPSLGLDATLDINARGIITNMRRIKKVTSTGLEATILTQYEPCSDVFRVNFTAEWVVVA